MISMLLTGVAVGSGWQAMVAYVNIGCYYIIGLPLGFLMGWVFKLGVVVSFSLVHFSPFKLELLDVNFKCACDRAYGVG